MSTDPSEARSPATSLHRDRRAAEGFGADPARFDRARPRYPGALIERIVAASPGPDVLDVGCGTGVAARQLQAAGCRVLGVEPDVRMADFARRSGVEVEVATFEAWEPNGRMFDAVVAATTWHWIDPAAGAVKAAQVLRPAGQLALFGHAFQLPPALVDAYRRVAPGSPTNLRPLRDGAVDAYQRMYASFADAVGDAGGFGNVQQWRIDWERSYTRDEWLDQVPTHGGVAQLPAGGLAAVLDAVGAAIDSIGGSFTLPYASVGVTAQRTPSA